MNAFSKQPTLGVIVGNRGFFPGELCEEGRKEILKVLEKFVVKPIDSLGKPFDPSYHQAVMQREHSGKPENTVVEELQRGYTMHDRLLRPAMVVVSKPGADQGNPAGERA